MFDDVPFRIAKHEDGLTKAQLITASLDGHAYPLIAVIFMLNGAFAKRSLQLFSISERDIQIDSIETNLVQLSRLGHP